jgi:hypothetical protein
MESSHRQFDFSANVFPGAIDAQLQTGFLAGVQILTGDGANNALNSGGNSVSDLSSSSGDLVSRAPKPAVGVS